MCRLRVSRLPTPAHQVPAPNLLAAQVGGEPLPGSPPHALQGVVEAGAVLEPAVHARGTVGQELHLAEGTRPEGSRGAAEVRPRCGRGAAEVRPRNADGCANGTSEGAASDGAAGGVTSETAAPRLSGVRMSEQDVSHIRISRDGPPSLAASLLMTVGQLPCGVCPTTSRWMPLAARDWTREGGGGSGMPLLRRCRPSTTYGGRCGEMCWRWGGDVGRCRPSTTDGGPDGTQ